jgi:uncharacterized protein YkwD
MAVGALAAAAAGAAAQSRDGRTPANTATTQVTEVAGLEAQVLSAINAFRREQGLPVLRASRALALAALGHSTSMAEHGFFRHAGWDGSPFWRRIKPNYPPQPGTPWGVGENMVWAAPGLSADQALRMWLNSPPHRKNLLTPAWRDVGLGAVHALAAPGVYQGLDVTILTADFGVR